MDFGAMGLDNLVCSNSASNNGGCFASGTDADVNKHRLYGSGFLKQESRVDEDDLRAFKQAKTAETMTKIPLQGCNDGGSLTESHQQMLSFSSPNSQMLSFSSHSSQPVMFPFYHHASSAINRSSGFGSGGVNAASMQEVLSVVRGPFTPSQWMELEHQALIYKYITANVPIPSYLLNPIRKALESSGFSCFSVLRPNAYLYHKYERRDVKIDMVPWNGKWTVGWGAFHLGFSNTDPEPGRCRRTDGKKWRCSRDAVADQKYCERHMNRGRHRSRKPVEGQSGHSASGITTTNGKSTPMASSMSMSVVPANGASKSLSLLHHQQLNNLQHGSNNQLSGKTSIDRSLLDKKNATGAYQHAAVLSVSSPKISFKDNEQNAYIETSRPEFGSVCSDSLLNPLNSSSSLVNSRNYGNSDNLSDHESKSQHALRQFIDDWPKNQSARSSISWPDVDLQADSTQLSISIPVVTSDFMSSTASPTNEKLTASPLRLSREVEATQMGLGVGAISSEQSQKQNSWVSVSWEPSIGGPLGEALHTTSNSTSECKNARALNLIENWDNSPRLASSSFGLLRGSYGSVSNSSAGSSPRAESSKTLDGASFCNGLIGPGLMLPSLPAL